MENRQFERFNRGLPASVFTLDIQGRFREYQGRLKDISAGGMCIIVFSASTAVLEPDIKIPIMIERIEDALELEITGRLVHAASSEDASQHVGIRFFGVQHHVIHTLETHRKLTVWL